MGLCEHRQKRLLVDPCWSEVLNILEAFPGLGDGLKVRVNNIVERKCVGVCWGGVLVGPLRMLSLYVSFFTERCLLSLKDLGWLVLKELALCLLFFFGNHLLFIFYRFFCLSLILKSLWVLLYVFLTLFAEGLWLVVLLHDSFADSAGDRVFDGQNEFVCVNYFVFDDLDVWVCIVLVKNIYVVWSCLGRVCQRRCHLWRPRVSIHFLKRLRQLHSHLLLCKTVGRREICHLRLTILILQFIPKREVLVKHTILRQFQ